jgi:hypothetical protein
MYDKSKFRPFQNADEFHPFRNLWVRVRESKDLDLTDGDLHRCVVITSDGVTYGDLWLSWGAAFDLLSFESGRPFGMEVVQ